MDRMGEYEEVLMEKVYDSAEDFFFVIQDTQTKGFVSDVRPVETTPKIGWAMTYNLTAVAETALHDSGLDVSRYKVRCVGYQFLE